MTDFGTRLKELRKERGLTQEQLAERLLVAFQTVSKWENGVSNPDFSLIAPLAEALQVSTDELLGADCRKQKQALEEEYRSIPQRNWRKRAEVLDRGLLEFPGDYRFCSLKADAYLYACSYDLDLREGEKELLLAECETLFGYALENPRPGKHGRMANLLNLVKTLMLREKKKEAIALAMKEEGDDRDQLLRICLEGEELRHHNQEVVNEKLKALIQALSGCAEPLSFDLARRVIEAFYPEKTACYYEQLESLACKEYTVLLRKGEYDQAELAYERLCATTDLKMACFEERDDPFNPYPWFSHPAMDALIEDGSFYKRQNPYMMTAHMGRFSLPGGEELLKREKMQALQKEMEEKRRLWAKKHPESDPFYGEN